MSLRSIKSNLDLSTSRRVSPTRLAPPLSKPIRQREKTPLKSGFTLKFGEKYHAFAFPEVPWPLGYEPEILDLDVLYHQFIKDSYGLTFVKFPEGIPRRVLDLGTGIGTWVVDAASHWKETEFVGLDVVPIQPALEATLEAETCSRIQWVTGNFLQKLPFDDNSFDYVRCVNVARGIPENKWLFLCQEISRVLKPSGAVEVLVHNIVFPYVPQIVSQTPILETPRSPVAQEFRGLERHEHSLLENLFFGVFERRFINVRPTSIVANYLNIHFKHVTETPVHFQTTDPEQGTTRPRLPLRFLAWQAVFGCKESMWEEAMIAGQETGKDLFHEIPPTEEEEGLTTRQRFELLFERYEQEMRSHTGLSTAIEKLLGWKKPGPNGERGDVLRDLEEDLKTLSKSEVALSQSSSHDVDMSRQISCFVGFKGGT